MRSTEKPNNLQSIERAFMVLQTVAVYDEISLHELYKELNFNKASLLRILSTLCSHGFVEKNIKSGNYSLTLKMFEIGMNAVRNLDYMVLIRKALSEISNETGLIAQFSIEDNNEILCLESYNHSNKGFYSIYTKVGQRSPMYSTSAGKAILSTYSNNEIISKFGNEELKKMTKNTTTNIQKFLHEVSIIRKRNFAVDLEENEYGVFCVGSVLINFQGKPIGALSLSSDSLTQEQQDLYSKILLECSEKLSNAIGYTQNR